MGAGQAACPLRAGGEGPLGSPPAAGTVAELAATFGGSGSTPRGASPVCLLVWNITRGSLLMSYRVTVCLSRCCMCHGVPCFTFIRCCSHVCMERVKGVSETGVPRISPPERTYSNSFFPESFPSQTQALVPEMLPWMASV